METIKVSQGLTAPFTAILKDSNGNVFTGYTELNSLAGTVRAGTDRTVLFSFTPVVIDSAAGKVAFSILGSDTENLPVGQYLLQITLVGNSACLVEALLEIGYSPGASVALPVYCSYQDILNHAPWVGLLQDPNSDDAGFAQVRAQARNDIDACIISNYHGGGGQFGSHSEAAFAWAGLGGLQPNDLIRQYLSENKLMAGRDPTRRDYRPKVTKMASFRSIAIIGLRQITLNPQHVAAGSSFQNLFLQELSSFVAELDTNLDGQADLVISCTSTNTVFG